MPSAPDGAEGQVDRRRSSELEAHGSVTDVGPVDVWVDAHRLVRRMTIVLAVAAGPQKVQVSFTIELSGARANRALSAPCRPHRRTCLREPK
jgi:hypothetical protein